jgi:cyclopropane fatty-acyl-phospholipid synthase-like methyltransferase
MFLRKILELPVIYNTYQYVAGAERLRKKIFSESIKISSGMKVLDVGCGTGDLIKYLPKDINYVGIDISPEYIDFARSRFGAEKNKEFICADVNELSSNYRNFDTIIAIGLLHHLNDSEVEKLLTNIRECLAPSGIFYSLDPLLEKKQSVIERFIITRDRGQYVRYFNEYEGLFNKVKFSSVRKMARKDLLQIPFTHLFVSAVK